MKNKYYLGEFQYFDGENTIVFNINDFADDSDKITVAVTSSGKISVRTYDVLEDENGKYFEYGVEYKKIRIGEFQGEEQ